MSRYRTSRTLPTILTIVVIILVIAGFVALARVMFGASSEPSDAALDGSSAQHELLSTEANRSVSMTVRGPIVADENFRSYSISISPSSRQFKAYKGYLETVTDQQTLANNTAAYSQFVHALDKANLTKGTQLSGDANNVLGVCATGSVYQFFILADDQTEHMFWTSTCKGSPGSLKASAVQLSDLFVAQIPGSAEVIKALDF